MTPTHFTPCWNFVPVDLDAGDLVALERLFEELEERDIVTAGDLETWLLDESELLSRYAAEVARRYIAMTRNTNDPTAKEGYISLERDVAPRVKVLADRLDRKFLDDPHVEQLDTERFEVLIRGRRCAREIFREENTALQAKESEIETQQQELMGAITVTFEGKEHTLQQMAPYAEKQDRDMRERAFRASLEERRKTWKPLYGIYDQLIGLRTKMARNAGFDSYTPYRFKQLQRFDYTADDCMRFHEAIEKVVVPAVGRLHGERKKALGLEALRPWDLEVDIDGRPPYRPFETEEELIDLCRSVFEQVDPRFATEFDLLRNNDLLDLMSRKGKAPGGYQYGLEDIRLPFIFTNGVGTHNDVQTLLHEGGHSFHSILCRQEPLVTYRDAPIEFAETASMSMELMGLERIGSVYDEENAHAERSKHLEGILSTLTWIASIDAFQHWIYAHPDHDAQARTSAWLSIRDRFSPGLDWSGIEDALENRWTGQGHLFTSPFYYIEYGIAQLAALQVWQGYRNDPPDAVRSYRQALALGGSRPLPELFAAAGVNFDLGEETLAALVADVEAAIAR